MRALTAARAASCRASVVDLDAATPAVFLQARLQPGGLAALPDGFRGGLSRTGGLPTDPGSA